jgi:hypothetical protein
MAHRLGRRERIAAVAATSHRNRHNLVAHALRLDGCTRAASGMESDPLLRGQFFPFRALRPSGVGARASAARASAARAGAVRCRPSRSWHRRVYCSARRLARGIIGGPHQMGTTGCRPIRARGSSTSIHYIDNLYVAGSSAFATGGYAVTRTPRSRCSHRRYVSPTRSAPGCSQAYRMFGFSISIVAGSAAKNRTVLLPKGRSPVMRARAESILKIRRINIGGSAASRCCSARISASSTRRNTPTISSRMKVYEMFGKRVYRAKPRSPSRHRLFDEWRAAGLRGGVGAILAHYEREL